MHSICNGSLSINVIKSKVLCDRLAGSGAGALVNVADADVLRLVDIVWPFMKSTCSK